VADFVAEGIADGVELKRRTVNPALDLAKFRRLVWLFGNDPISSGRVVSCCSLQTGNGAGRVLRHHRCRESLLFWIKADLVLFKLFILYVTQGSPGCSNAISMRMAANGQKRCRLACLLRCRGREIGQRVHRWTVTHFADAASAGVADYAAWS
jgi:hypothetical protein